MSFIWIYLLLFNIGLDDCSNINTYVGEDGLIHFTNSAGADTVLNFSSGVNIKTSTVSASAATVKNGTKSTTITFSELTEVYGLKSRPTSSDNDVILKSFSISGNKITVTMLNLHTSSNPSLSGKWTAVGI